MTNLIIMNLKSFMLQILMVNPKKKFIHYF